MNTSTDLAAVNRNLLVLAKREPLEAMRVAAGLTIFGHTVTLVLMAGELNDEQLQSEQFELLELADIEPLTTHSAMSDKFTLVNAVGLGKIISTVDAVVNL
jgi:hypothetical protein